MSIKRQLIKSFMGVGAMKMLSIPISLATSIILARTLGPEGFGQYAFIMALIPMIALPVSGGLPQLLTREVASFVHANNWSLYKGVLRSSHGWVVFASAAILGLFWLFGMAMNLMPSGGKWSLLPIGVLIVPLAGLGAARAGAIKGLGMPALAEIPVQLIQPIFLLIIFGTMAWLHLLDPVSAIWGQVVAAALVFIIASWLFYRIQPKVIVGIQPRYRLRQWRSALLPFSLLAAISVLNTQIGIIILGLLGSDEQVAAMRVAERGGQFVVMSLTLVNLVIAPYIVRAQLDGDKTVLQKLAQKSSRGSFLLALPVALILIIAGEALIGLAFGAEYIGIAYWPIVIIALGQLINVFFGSVGYLLTMSGYEKDTLRGQSVAVIVNVLLCILLVPDHGAVGAAIAVSTSLVIWNMILAIVLWRRIGIISVAFWSPVLGRRQP